MNILNKYIKGDRYLWAFIGILAIFSFLPVYSASTNLVLNHNNETIFHYLFKHALFLIIGFFILFITQLIDYKYFGGLAILAMPIIFILLLLTLFQGQNIEGSNAARWIKIRFINISFQTSTISIVILLIYCARYLAKNKNKSIYFIDSLLKLIIPILINIALILPANGSTAAMLFIFILILLFIGGYPFKHLLILISTVIFFTSMFIIVVLNWKNKEPTHRVNTWKNRIEDFFMQKNDLEENYQVKIAKTAIILGGKFGRGPGKSVLKAFLPQSSSDFIYAIIVEEYGSIGGIIVIFIYVLILFRILIILTKIEKYFASLLILSVGLPIIIQALINMGVAVHLLPVTGQTLPLISAGGTSIWISCFSFGVILSVSRIIKKQDSILNKKIKDYEEESIA